MAGRYGTVLFLLLAGAALGGDPPRAGIPRNERFQQRVDDAVARGVAWLRDAQGTDGSFADYPKFPGATTALAYQTLRVCGAQPGDAAATRAWSAMRRTYRKEDLLVYSAAIYLMAIAERASSRAEETAAGLSASERAWAAEIARCLAGGQRPDGTWNYDVSDAQATLRFPPRYYDHSNTQYALLGLHAAGRCGIGVDREIWKRSLLHFLDAQEPSGPAVQRGADAGEVRRRRTFATVADRARGWGYQSCNDPPDPIYVRAEYSMTAAGVSSVVICRSELLGTGALDRKTEAASERAVWDGLAWLGSSRGSRSMIRLDGVAEEARRTMLSIVDFYEAYGVERAGVLAGVEWMSALDWYGVGAEVLLATQAADGSWQAPREGRAVNTGTEQERASARRVVDTCFALLFLKRGTAPVRVGAVTSSGADDDINFAVAATLEGRDLGDFLDLVLARWRRATDAEVKTRLFDGATSAGPRIVEPLLMRMDDADAAVRNAAHALLQHATGQDFGFVPDAKPDLRERALVLWQKWWMTSKDRLVYGATAKKLVVR